MHSPHGMPPCAHICFFVCKYAQWPHCCSHMRRDHTEVTDDESELKLPIGIKGHNFIRIIHPNTISCIPIRQGEEWRHSAYTMTVPFS